MYKRIDYKIIIDRMNEPRKFIQVIMGPRQVEDFFKINPVELLK